MKTTLKKTQKKLTKPTPAKKAAAKKVTKRVTKKATAAKRVTTKKAAAKSTAKKTTIKKVAKKVSTRKKPLLVCAEGSDCFWIHQGPVLEDLHQLRDALHAMTDDTYGHHVNKERNDFADWVEFVLQDATLAAGLRKSKKPNTARALVVKRLRYYT